MVQAAGNDRADDRPLLGEPLFSPLLPVLSPGGHLLELVFEGGLVFRLAVRQRVAFPTPPPAGLPDGGMELRDDGVVRPPHVFIGEEVIFLHPVAAAAHARPQ